MTTLDEGVVDLEALMLDPDLLTDEDAANQVMEEVELSEAAGTFVHRMVIKFLLFGRELNGRDLYPYQYVLAYRIIESVILNDGAHITALMARQSGKTETVAVVIATLMLLLPRLAKRYPTWFGDFERGLMVGCFAPVEDQAQTLFGRIVGILTSERAVEMMEEPDIDDRADGGGKFLQLVNCRSFVRLQTANPRANIESKTYHIVVIDEAQGCDYTVVRKSIIPMLASTNGTIIRTGTPTTEKGEFYDTIKTNQRQDAKRGNKKQNHFSADYREVMKYNIKYKKHIAQQMVAIGKDSDEFQMSYALRWLLERGMFTTEEKMDELGDPSMKIQHEWKKSRVVAGIDIARKQDATVVTVLWVDWDNPDQFGFYEHRVLNWLEITGDQWEEQYAQVVDFLSNYDVFAVGVDGQGMGDLFADRLSRLMPNVDVRPLGSSNSEQSKRWKHLTELMQRNAVIWPAHSWSKRTRNYKRFRQQMLDAERKWSGPNVIVEAPNEADAHDDYPDSLALATFITKDLTMPEVVQSENPMYAHRRR